MEYKEYTLEGEEYTPGKVRLKAQFLDHNNEEHELEAVTQLVSLFRKLDNDEEYEEVQEQLVELIKLANDGKEVECTTCEGEGFVEHMKQCNVYPIGECCGGCTVDVDCLDCDGEGTVIVGF